ncbi:PBECR2 nuclease fold domain-containing protein, partial [Campylobacter upsaliensis]|uniref:PBECR3 domain-containing polyvalent protein n=1 Tax=Campylobacter upsaliensis TaxID=28080 RepID=UPI00214A84CD
KLEARFKEAENLEGISNTAAPFKNETSPQRSNESIAQKTTKQSEKEELERQIPFIEAEIQKYEAKIARLDERIKKTQTRIQPYLDEINALQKQYDELYFTETRGEEANAKKWLKLDEIKAKQEELRKPYNDELFKFIRPYQRLKGKVQTEIQKLKFGLQDRAERLEEIQNEALTSKAQKAWLEAFGLKSLEEAYTPKFSKEVNEALEKVLNGEQIKLTKGSYEKLLKRDREEFLPFIKETLENADAVVKDKENALIFVKDIGKKSYFTSVAKNANNEWVISTNSLKTLNTLKNRLNDNGELLYLSKEASNILAEAFTKRAFSNELASESIAQNNKALDYYSKKQNELSDEHDKLVMKSFSHTLNKAEQARLNLLKEELIQNEALKRQEINTLASQKITKYNDLLKTLKDSFNNRQIYNDIYVDLLGNTDELIEILKKDDEKIGLFIHQLNDPLKNDNELHGAGISYKAKKLKNGDIRVTGGGISDAKLQKSIRLNKMERERLHLAFAREYNMQGFINDSHREDFFKRLSRAVSEYYDDFHLDRVDYKKYLYSQDRILESDSITQAKQKLEKEREAFREFLEQSATKEANKELKSDLLDKTKPLRKAEKEELTKEVLEEAKKQNAKIWVGNLENESLADELGLDFQKGVKITMNGNALKHIENRHGVNSTLAKNGQPIVENEDYANHAKIVNEADKRKIILSEDNQKILVSGKQINGYHIIVESISTKDNELKLKTMYKENGSLENSNIFKEPVRDRKSGGESLRVNPSNALDPNGSS